MFPHLVRLVFLLPIFFPLLTPSSQGASPNEGCRDPRLMLGPSWPTRGTEEGMRGAYIVNIGHNDTTYLKVHRPCLSVRRCWPRKETPTSFSNNNNNPIERPAHYEPLPHRLVCTTARKRQLARHKLSTLGSTIARTDRAQGILWRTTH
jgi:hypothetical protein